MDRSKRILVLVKDGDDDIYIYEGYIGEDDKNPKLVGEAIMYNYKDKNKEIYKKLLSDLKTLTKNVFKTSENVFKTSHENVFIITQQYLNEINKEQKINKNYRKNTYEGFFLDNERNGLGVLTTYDEDGIRLTNYDGEWLNDQRNGRGVLTTYDERDKPVDIYKGNWLEDKKNGDGVLTTYDELGNPVTKYEGEWLNDQRNGRGVLITYDVDGNSVYEGEWLNDQRNGHGVLTTYDVDGNSVKKYEGNWENNVSLKGHITFYFVDQECLYHDAEFDNEDPDKILKAKVFIRYFEKIIDEDDEDKYKIIDRAIMYGTIDYDAAASQYNAELVIVGVYPSDIFKPEELIRVEVEEESQKPKRNKLTQDAELLGIPELTKLLYKQNEKRLKYTYSGPIVLDNNGKLKSIDESRWKPPIQLFVLLSPDSQSSQESQSSVGTSQESQEGAGGKKTRKRKYQKRKQTRKIYLRRNKRSKKISTKKSRK